MNRALHKMTDEEREIIVESDKVILARVLKAMNEPDHFEHKKPKGIPLNLVAYAAALCVVVAWVVVGRL